MAARRLILVMLVLLVLSSAVAALIPVDREPRDETSTSTTTTTTAPPSGDLHQRRIDADRREPRTIMIERGDQLELTVTSSKPGQVEIFVLGLFDDVDRFLPARFDLLPADRGTYPVRFIPPAPPAARGRVIAHVVVGGPGEPQERSEALVGASGCSRRA